MSALVRTSNTRGCNKNRPNVNDSAGGGFIPFPFPGYTGILHPSASLIVTLGPCDLHLRHRNVRRRICANSKQACPPRPPCDPTHPSHCGHRGGCTLKREVSQQKYRLTAWITRWRRTTQERHQSTPTRM